MEKMKFEEMSLSKEIKKAIKDMGFEEASPIQEQTIPIIMEGHDLVGQAQTGTGKTAAFGIPMLEMIDTAIKKPQVLVLCPTRELAIQVAEEFKKLSKYKKDISILPVYGGQSIERQIQALRKGIQIIIGTPGRVLDHISRNTLKLNNINKMILDEADEMFNMGFRDDIEKVLKMIPEERQTIFFSATMPKDILDFANKFQSNPKFIKVVHKEMTVPNVEQCYYEVKENMKTEVLCRLLDIKNPKLSMVFCNTKRKVDDVTSQLQARGYLADGLHGDLKQSQRDRVMEKFRKGTIDILVATDVAARGIDIGEVEAVFNYDVPQDDEYYVHRIGRTARAGRSGSAFTFVAGREIYKLKDIQRYTKTKVKRQNIPTISDVEESKNAIILDRVRTIIDEDDVAKYVSIIGELLDEDYTSLDIAGALMKLYMSDERINNEEIETQEYAGETGAEEGMVRLFINIGRNNNVGPGNILGAITGETGIPGKLIGRIDIYDKYTFVEVPAEYAESVLKSMKDNKINGNKIKIEPANPKAK